MLVNAKKIAQDAYDKNPEREFADLYEISELLELPTPWDDISKESKYEVISLGSWLCTDSHVGWDAHYYDGKPFAISYLSARKSAKEWAIVDEKLTKEFRSHMIELMSFKLDSYITIDENFEIPQYFGIKYVSQLLPKYKNHMHMKDSLEKVNYIKHHGWKNNLAQDITVEFADGIQKRIDIRDVVFPMGVI